MFYTEAEVCVAVLHLLGCVDFPVRADPIPSPFMGLVGGLVGVGEGTAAEGECTQKVTLNLPAD